MSGLVPFLHVQLYARVVCSLLGNGRANRAWDNVTHRIAGQSTGGNLALSSAHLRASIRLSLAPVVLQVLGDLVGINSAAGANAGGQAGSVVLRTRKAGEGRGGNEKRCVEHGEWRGKYQCLLGRQCK